MGKQKILRSVGTHDGTFHADEVTACALLVLFDLADRDKIIRTRNPDLLSQCEYLCDIGGKYDPSQKLFDHHQVTYRGDFSSAGMVLAYLKEIGKIKPNEYHHFHTSLMMGVDAFDTGKDPLLPGYCSYSQVISNFTPIEFNSGSKEEDRAFQQALEFSIGHLKRMLGHYQYFQTFRPLVQKVMEKEPFCLIFEKKIPWLELFFELGGNSHPAQFAIFPSNGNWFLRTIPPSDQDQMNVRKPLPEEWAGLLDEELQKISKIPGAIFCHKGRFISVWKTKEDALKALEYIQKKEKMR